MSESAHDYDTHKNRCPECMYYNEGAADLWENGEAPKDGDIILCLNCGVLTIWQGSAAIMRRASKRDLRGMDVDVLDRIRLVQTYIKRRGRFRRKTPALGES